MLITDMTKAAARQICSWNYEYPYSVYNYLPYDEAVRTGARITLSEYKNDYLCFWNENDTLIGYLSLIKKADKLFLGIGLAPEYCSKGLGKTILLQSIKITNQRYGDEAEIWVQVRSWNERAIKCYTSCGFEAQYCEELPDRFGNIENFCFMNNNFEIL